MATITSTDQPHILLVGAGIMSATLAVFLKELDPSLKIQLHEVLGSAAQESSNAWNNAGTGHAALCELNYTPQEPDGSMDISKALQVNTEFDLSRQFWAYLVRKGAIRDPQSFLHSVPHMSFVRGQENRIFLKKRFEALTAHPLYYGMEYSSKNIWLVSSWNHRRNALKRFANSIQTQRKKIGRSKLRDSGCRSSRRTRCVAASWNSAPSSSARRMAPLLPCWVPPPVPQPQSGSC